MLQWFRNLLSSDSKELVALPSCSNQDGRPVHQLWPPEDDVSIAEFDVVFFHGLQRPDEVETWKRTWANRTNPQDCWAQNWLPHDFGGNIRVLALSYDSCAVQTDNKGHIEDVSEIGRNILQTLVFSNRWKLGQQCGFVLVGHCFGGFVIKSLVEEANKRAYGRVKNKIDEQSKRRANKFLKNLKGIVFFAVPHAGSELESYFKRCSSNWSNKIFGVKLARFMENLKPHQSRMESLSTTFDSIMNRLRVNVYAFMEGIPTKDAGYKLVEKAGAQRLAGENYYLVEDGDHFTLCKPPSKDHPSYALLVQFLKTCQHQVIYHICSRAQQDEVQNTMHATSRRPRNKECSSKYYGVRFRPDLSKWVAEIRVAEWKSVDKKVWLGTYISEEGAAHAVDAARKILRCNKKQKPNFSCERLEAYAESLPPVLSLSNISDNTIFKAITEFVTGKARQYASEFASTPLPIPKEIRTSTPVNYNRQPGAGGDVSPSDAAAVCQLGSITTDPFELVSYLDHGVKAIEVPRDFSSELSHQQLSPFHATAVIAASDNFFEEVYGEEFLDGNGHITTPCSSMMFLPGVSLDWSQQQPVSASTGEAVVHQDSIFMSLEEGFMMLSQPEPTHWTQDQIFGLDFNTEHMPANSDMWVENYLGSCAEEPIYTDAPMEEVDPGRALNGSWDTKLVPSFTIR